MREALPPFTPFDLCFTMAFISKPTVLVGRKITKMLMITVFLSERSCLRIVTQLQHKCTVYRYIKEKLPNITRNAVALLSMVN
jgi:hypothetical protein